MTARIKCLYLAAGEDSLQRTRHVQERCGGVIYKCESVHRVVRLDKDDYTESFRGGHALFKDGEPSGNKQHEAIGSGWFAVGPFVKVED